MTPKPAPPRPTFALILVGILIAALFLPLIVVALRRLALI